MVIRISNIDTICWIWRSVIKFAIFLRSNTLIFSQTIIITFTMASWMDASTIASWWPLCVTIGNYTVSLWMCRQWTSITKENRRTHRIEHISPVVISKALMKGIALITHIFNFHVVCNQRIDINSKCTGNYHLFLSPSLTHTQTFTYPWMRIEFYEKIVGPKLDVWMVGMGKRCLRRFMLLIGRLTLALIAVLAASQRWN